ncbi:serine/threonine-protein kinase [Paeniglutamicibacter psychrophenolicus]|uniref:serine/threonine-protein kinase n=1 Tax=Paeniglutamicibacter psychrophenolicus TaxID=257454 RepID=UPI00278A3731|nr:serine/threonine-protein kinase [Paeniglutamicibacter psychrophenolicus]MDQ0094713.1 serine/threonine-protein kinase [Paeniglutamicibacter psychrophenolicus]
MKKQKKILEIEGVSYTFESILGHGGTAEVWKVRSADDDKVYALKKILKHVRSDRRNERFRKEIEFGLAARNDHVVRIHAKSEDEKYFYYTMDLYPESLRAVIENETDHQVILDYLSQLCEGLAYIHQAGVVHRDIKPENILVDSKKRRLVLADFGIAHFKDSTLTTAGELLANRNYQAPEQMVRNGATDIGKPADIFALGLIITEIFTKQNSRGARHRRVGEIHPFLSDLDMLLERMMLQDETQRIGIQAARDWLRLIRRQLAANVEGIMEELRTNDAPTDGSVSDANHILKQAAMDVLSAKYIFERTTKEEISLYNPNYHCEIDYRVTQELYNSCVQSKLYSICKAKFEYEANSTWNDSDQKLVVSPFKKRLQSEFESLQRQYPLARSSIWAGLPSKAAHYFRFCKDYHCREILESIQDLLSVTPGSSAESLHRNLVGAPIIWIARSVREYLETDFFELSLQNLQSIEFDRQVIVHWEGTSLEDSSRKTTGAELFDKSSDAEIAAQVLGVFESRWDVSVGQGTDGSYSIYFPSSDEYERFRKSALAIASEDYWFRGDVLDLLRPVDQYEDLVVLSWGPTFDIRSTLAKVLKLREI